MTATGAGRPGPRKDDTPTMTRPLRLAPRALLLALFAAGCSTEPAPAPTVEIDELFPADNEIGSWVEDTTVGAAGVEIADSPTEAEAIIDGDAEPFTAHDFARFAIQNYTNGSEKLELRVWQMADAAAATAIYDYLPANNSIYMASSWEDVSIGEAGRASNTGASWWINARTGAFYVEAKINAVSDAARADAEAFARAVVGKVP